MSSSIPTSAELAMPNENMDESSIIAAGDRIVRSYRRSRSGCYTCRLRAKKCDETRPRCLNCNKLGILCQYTEPSWWRSLEQRKIHRDRIKKRIRVTKVMKKEKDLQGNDSTPLPPQVSVPLPSQPFLQPPLEVPQPRGSNAYPEALHAPERLHQRKPQQSTQQRSRRPSRRPSNRLPTPTSSGPNHLAIQGTTGRGSFLSQTQYKVGSSRFQHQDKPLSTYLRTMNVSKAEKPLLNHFVDNLLQIIFPVLDAHPQSIHRTHEILRALKTNKSYYHCCLSVSALHIKTLNANSSWGDENESIDDIMRHRYAAISALCQALDSDDNHDKVLDATLAMIFFHCAVGEPDDYLPDIPWYDHFTAVADLVNKLGINEPTPFTPLPFSTSLATWIDILGATMLGTSPRFAHTYRTKHLNGVSSGLRDLMGCDDSVMYIISEIACLDALKTEGRLDDYTICHHVSALTTQLGFTDAKSLEAPVSSSGRIDPKKLTLNITATFRAAARVYLSTLVPGFDRSQQSTANLVQAVGDTLQFIPEGPYGYDRALVWPLLIAGVYSTPGSNFRDILAQRTTAIGDAAEYGSFGRMYRVLKETWKISDEPMTPLYSGANYLLPSMNLDKNTGPAPRPPPAETIGRPLRKQMVHWRDIMSRNGWRYLLI
ncbi:hypothetical protein BP00DRAFT_394877 [Aspergillus indologenus CBS 114.80]|uniref:Zn(2)-C6 fungal-type domain-containing protein n=1 Tax=Aspergillus indologenus CBS 114.80 TaxID=1450541 RepID=A0A2V5IUI4_9EURO|nr:hypothetical protein BP00DRAFT_394877 [Aspergillus indologenus CBS 114.80]